MAARYWANRVERFAAAKRLADGSIKKYYYQRGTGKRIKGEPGTPEFVASYAEAAKPEQTDIGTFSALITGYVTSPKFGKLAEKMAAKEARRAQFKKAN